MRPTTIHEVISVLEEIIARERKEHSAIGYFASLYRTVTLRIKEGIEHREFEDNPRMERLDVIFANRFIDAYNSYKKKERPTLSWEYAFQQDTNYWPIVLQHLLLGMNAHINLDLGIAAEETSPGEKISEIRNDFDKINLILFSLVAKVENDLASIWPTLKFLLKVIGRVDNFMIDFNMEHARKGSWKFANQLAKMNEQEKTIAIKKRDEKIYRLAVLCLKPGIIARLLFGIIRLREKGSVEDKINELYS
ncbi:MAG: DUF5995 family protein [Saprospiraceae bacterium]